MSDPQINGTASVTAKWPAELDRAIDLYRAEKFQECIAHTRTVCRDNAPLHPRLRYRILLASCLDDWHEAEDMRFHAENTYNSWCLYNPVSSFPGAGQVRSDLRNNLDQLADYFKAFRPKDWKQTQRFRNNIEAAEAEEEYAAELAEEQEEEAPTTSEEEEEEIIASSEEEDAAAAAEREEEDTAAGADEGKTVFAADGEQDATAAITTQAGEDAVIGAEREEEIAAAVAQAGVGNTQAESVERTDLPPVVGNGSNIRNTRRSRSTRIPAP